MTMNEKGLSTLKICEQKLKYLNYSEKTIKIYTWYINQFLKSQNKSCEHLNSRDFQSYLNNYKFTSISQQNQIINAIKFLYEKALNKKYNKVSFERPKKERHLPQVIDKNHIINQINKINNLKHKAILSLTFSVGLRVSEVINLRIKDIDSRRMLININNAKGRKDRIVPLSINILNLLRDYYRIFKPKVFLFNGQFQLKYSAGSCQKIFKKYIDENSHFHILRHSCFTSLLECGTDLRIIQKMAGHSSSKTTEIYTHISTALLQKVALPL